LASFIELPGQATAWDVPRVSMASTTNHFFTDHLLSSVEGSVHTLSPSNADG